MTPCNAFSRVTTSVYATISKMCSQNIKNSWEKISSLGKTDEGRTNLSKIFRTCEPIKSNENVTLLKNYLKDMYTNIAMVNYPYPASFIGHLPAHPVKAVCKYLTKTQKTETDLLKNVFKAVSIYANGTGKAKCFDYTKSVDSFGESGWDFQSCTEMVMPMCDNEDSMFEKSFWNFKNISDKCYKKFKITPEENKIRNLFGGKNIHWASNIIFSNGLLDPWSSGGVLYNLSSTAVAVVIPESAHHLDLRSSNERDPPTVIMARRYYQSMIKEWIL